EGPASPAAVGGDAVEAEEGVVGDPDGVEADVFGAAGEGEDVAPAFDAVAHGAVAVGDVETELERSRAGSHRVPFQGRRGVTVRTVGDGSGETATAEVARRR